MSLSPEMTAALQKSTIQPRWLFSVSAKNRLTGEVEEMGLWTGLGDITLNVDGKTKTYTGAGSLLSMDGLVYKAGLNVQSQEVSLSLLDSKVVNMLRVYDPKMSPVTIHLVLLDEFEQLVGNPHRCFKGFIDTLDITESEDDATASVKLVSSIRNGTKPLYLKQSHQQQLKRDPTDMGREFAAISGEVKIYWGMGGAYEHRYITPINPKALARALF